MERKAREGRRRSERGNPGARGRQGGAKGSRLLCFGALGAALNRGSEQRRWGPSRRRFTRGGGGRLTLVHIKGRIKRRLGPLDGFFKALQATNRKGRTQPFCLVGVDRRRGDESGWNGGKRQQLL